MRDDDPPRRNFSVYTTKSSTELDNNYCMFKAWILFARVSTEFRFLMDNIQKKMVKTLSLPTLFCRKTKLLLQKCPRNKNNHIWKTNKSLFPCLSNNNNNNKQKYLRLQNGSFCEQKVSAFISSSTASARSVAKAVARCCGGSSSSCASVGLCRRCVARWWKRRKAAASWCQQGGCANGGSKERRFQKKTHRNMAFFSKKVFFFLIFLLGGLKFGKDVIWMIVLS